MRSFTDPVFVLCNGRSGSTLLRFLLDAHPDLACPPETNLPALCGQLATVWSLIAGAPLSANRGDEPPEIPDAAIAGVRETMDRMVGSYLERRGKKRYCDKSLGTARYAELISRVYPDASFICLYRHPMDVIASGAEACPWGLHGYGFDPYIAATPGNAVMALANFWVDSVRATLAAEERFPGKCLRLRYEDLVAAPEPVMAEVFGFLGVSPSPGITGRCFSSDRERFGPADYKIWNTSEISSDSVGRGWSVPIGMIAPQMLGAVNELASQLGYLTVDGDWGSTEPPADFCTPVAARNGHSVSESPADDAAAQSASVRAVTALAEGPLRSRRLGERLHAELAAVEDSTRERWGLYRGESFVAVAITDDAPLPAEYWQVNLADSTVTSVTKEAQEISDWDVIGSVEVWEQVIDRRLNLSVALRSCALRYCDDGETGTPVAADARLGIIACLLGVANWD
jgi:protein-tyrosine sulfotransferase